MTTEVWMTQGIPGAVAVRLFGKNMVVFSLGNKGSRYHIRTVYMYRRAKHVYPRKVVDVTMRAVCTHHPSDKGKMRQAYWYITQAQRPPLGKVCVVCMQRTKMGTDLAPRESLVIWGDAVFAFLAAHGLHITP